MAESTCIIQAKSDEPLSQYGDLLTVQDVCEVLGISSRTVYRYVEQGSLTARKVGRRLYFPRKAFAAQIGLDA